MEIIVPVPWSVPCSDCDWTNAEVRLVDDPIAKSMFMSLDCIKPCYPELPDVSWIGHTSVKTPVILRSRTVKQSI